MGNRKIIKNERGQKEGCGVGNRVRKAQLFWISAPNTISALLAFDCVDRDEPNLRPHLMESLQWGVGIPLSWIGWFRGYRACCPSLEEGGGSVSRGTWIHQVRSDLVWLWAAATTTRAAPLHQSDLHLLPSLHLAARLLRLGGWWSSADLSTTYNQLFL